MRIILIIAISVAVSTKLFAQTDFVTLDKQTYDYYLKGDYKNLKKTGEEILSRGIDYYYLRLRLGISAYNNQHYSSAVKHFGRVIDFYALDSLSKEYIYYSYLFAGRKSDAILYLQSIPNADRNKTLRSIKWQGLTNVYVSYSTATSDTAYYNTNSFYFESVKHSRSINAGFETNFSSSLKGNFEYSNFQKTGLIYSSTSTSGSDLDFTQNQIYAKLTKLVFPGWEFSGFGSIALFSDNTTNNTQQGRRQSSIQLKSEYVGGVGIAKNSWKVRLGANVSFSNFNGSSQLRGEGYFTYLPFGNLNLYLTSGGMYQSDNNWGGTYQMSQELGFKALKFLWVESGVIKGNSFLYARNQGLIINNSYLIPATSIYGNLIFIVGQHFNITASAYFSKNETYSWDLTSHTRTDLQLLNSYGGKITLTYKIK